MCFIFYVSFVIKKDVASTEDEGGFKKFAFDAFHVCFPFYLNYASCQNTYKRKINGPISASILNIKSY